MKLKYRKVKAFSEVDPETWTEIKCKNYFGRDYIKVINWTNRNTISFHARSSESFWFENEKDAFKFKLKWGGEKDDEEHA